MQNAMFTVLISALNKMPLQGYRVYVVNVAIIIAAVVVLLLGGDAASAATTIAFALSGLFMRHTLSKNATQVGYTNALLEVLVEAEKERRAKDTTQ